ncbi:molybdenum cofactor guanylyltransferase [hot springs metagenome]|uniref:Molybdenum cofactor guanylyltransferase n=1 Tax=hot springs metagenome TaxID=433727 RepID=A0A5J4L7L9_9ZZZZ
MNITSVILAGGENRRFPTLKGFIKIGNNTIIGKNLSLLMDIFDEVFISTNMPEKYFHFGVPLIGDVLPSKGPLSGIYSSLINSKNKCIFVLACDMPFIKKELVSFICKRHIEASKGMFQNHGATIPIYNRQPQPLFGIYCKSAISYFEDCILEGKTSMKRILSEINTHFISESDIMTVDYDGRSFVNINTIEDYEKAVTGSLIAAPSHQ